MSILIRPPDLEVPESDPFCHDALGRKDLEPPLTQLVSQAEGPLVLAIDGPWGTGKTTFLKMWQAKLKNTGHACLYLNAWQTDFAKDPLVAVVGELSKTISDLAPDGKVGNPIRRNLKKAQAVAGSIVKRSIPVAIKLATAGVLDTSDVLEENLASLAADIAKDRIKDYEKGKSEIQEFRESLERLARGVAALKSEESAKVVIIVDELDRCRPTYAVELLERVKHLFDVRGVVFILGIDRSQLNHSVRGLYGTDFDAPGYLRKFIDLDYRLPDPKQGDYCQHLFHVFGIRDLILRRASQNRQTEMEILETILSTLFSASRFSLRTQIQTVARLRVVLQTIPRNHYLYGLTLAILLFLREWRRDDYERFTKGTADVEQVLSDLESLPGMKKILEEHAGHLI